MNINALCKESHAWAVKNGWYSDDHKRNVGELIALIHSELSEALEEARDGKYKIYYKKDENNKDKPEGFPVEIADTLIRIFDMCGYLKIDIEEALKIKMKFNKTRKFRHGGKHF